MRNNGKKLREFIKKEYMLWYARKDRVYIEKGNMTKLGDVKYFTFEPHISFPDSKYGYKKENIYYFDENGLMKL